MGQWNNIKNMTQKDIYNLGSLHSINNDDDIKLPLYLIN
jgi:hypothetical protein